jgi:hypothetical protein
MGKPPLAGPERFEPVAADGVTVWKSNSVQPIDPTAPIAIDTGRVLFWRKRIVVRNAR